MSGLAPERDREHSIGDQLRALNLGFMEQLHITKVEQSAKVNLNAADAETLRRDLFGIGAAKAKAIVAYRDSNGPFTAVDELLEVKGIGKALLEKNRERLSLN